MPDAPALLARDQAILRAIAAGKSTREICAEYKVSPNTLSALRKRVDVRDSGNNALSPLSGSTRGADTTAIGRPHERSYNLAERVAAAVSESLTTVATLSVVIRETDWADPGAGERVATLAGLVHAAERLGTTAAQLLAILQPVRPPEPDAD